MTHDVELDDGLRLHVRSAGHGPPLVLLHGFTGSTETWAPFEAAFGARVTTIAVDLPGHGRSSAPADPARYALPRFASDLARVLDALAVTRAAVLGYSLGGRAALHFALRHPDRVAALILESASPGIGEERERAERAAADAALAEAIERDGVPAFVDRWEQLPLWASQAALPRSTRAALRAQRLRNDARGLANSLRGAGAGAAPSVAHRLHELHMPALIVAGELDPKYVAIGQALAAALPHAQLLRVPEAGHAVHVERPERFAGAVLDFLNGVPSADGRWS